MDKDEDDLLRRFNALRAPQHDLGTPRDAIQAKKAAAATEDDDLRAIADGRRVPEFGNRGNDDELDQRIRRLKGEDAQAGNEEDDEVEAYLANLSSAKARATDVDDVDSIIAAIRDARRPGLEDEAVRALDHADLVTPRKEDNDERDGDASDDALDPEENDEEIIARALAEASLERQHEPLPPPTSAKRLEPESSTADDATSFAFPSLPTHLPVDDEPEPDIDDDTKKRLDLLLGLSGPTQKPGQATLPAVPKRAPGQGWNLPGSNDARDDDQDSWCCICNKDADVICLGCDNDPFCTACWTEGHEFEKHRTKKFTWARKSGA